MRRTAAVPLLLVLLGAPGCARSTAVDAPVRQETITWPEACGPAAPSRAPRLLPGEDRPLAGGAPEQSYFGVTAGVRPYFHAERSKLPHKLVPDGPLGYEAGLFISDEEMGAGRLSLAYLPLEEDDQDRRVNCFWLDLSAGPEYRLWDAAVSGKLRCEFGFSLLYLDFEKDTYNTYAVGGLGRGIFGMYAGDSAVGLEFSFDAHGWVGADAHDFQTSWAGTLGVNLVAKF
jgi:hypothetical protein